jgi:hypothetical protein
MFQHSAELQFLIEGHLADTLDAAQEQRLSGLLRADVDARRLFLEYMDLNAELQWSLQSRRGARLASEISGDIAGAAKACVSSTTESLESLVMNRAAAPIVFGTDDDSSGASAKLFGGWAKPWTVLLGSFTIFGLLLMGLFVIRDRLPAGGDLNQPSVAATAHSAPSSLQLTSGMAKLVLPNVGYVVLEGPGEFTLLSEKRAKLTSGRIKMRVTEVSGRGFVVETPYGEITDLGTEFGVDLNEQGKAGVVVFEGSVDLRVAKKQSTMTSDPQRLVGGEGVVFNDTGHFDRIGSISTGSVGTFMRSSEKSADGSVPLIVDVSDNLRTSETKKFYEIVPAGLKEDSLAYVDRPQHEWNGLTAGGMPKYLLGADYIKPFCDDKARRDVKVSVTLSRPAKLYVFMDARLTPPAWLKRQFRNTSDKIGLDIGNWHAPSPNLSSEKVRGLGPGQKVDHTFTVWERTIYEAGTITLGSNPGNKSPYGNAAMYGIAAVALDPKVTAKAGD